MGMATTFYGRAELPKWPSRRSARVAVAVEPEVVQPIVKRGSRVLARLVVVRRAASPRGFGHLLSEVARAHHAGAGRPALERQASIRGHHGEAATVGGGGDEAFDERVRVGATRWEE